MIIKVKLGGKGQVVIPKVIRESVGLRENNPAIMEVRGRRVEIRPLETGDLVKFAEETAKRVNADVSKWVMGDKLYEEEFG